MTREPIAIIGMGCRFPGSANDPETYWKNLIDGKDAITLIPEDRWNIDVFYGGDKIHPSRSRSKWGGFVDGIKEFDAKFFGISSTEAGILDPQQRMLLETAWHALEDAGVKLTGPNSIGVYVGAGNYEFAMGQYALLEPVKTNPYSATGSILSLQSSRISHFLNLTGPSMTVDTACSASLTALHLACRAIWNNECKMALGGGVNCIMYPSGFISFSNFGGLSADGRCKAFDASADGFVKAEGAGMVLLKPLKAALKDQDRIYALIHNTKANQDGHTPVIAAPNMKAQESLINEALKETGVSPDKMRYVEAHGTGTSIGDPIEAHAIGRSIGRHKSIQDPCFIGSVKTNIGHLETASGVAGLIKNALICHHGVIPKNLHFNTPNPEIEFDRYHLKVVSEKQPLPSHSDQGQCFIGLNSFGFGGANAFILMSPFAQKNIDSFKYDRPETSFRYMLPFSARSEGAFKAGIKELDTLIDTTEGNNEIQHICAAAARRRAHHKEYNTILTGNSALELKEQINIQLTSSHKLNKPVSDKAVFVFSGQGPQWYAMGRQLYKTEKIFRDTIHEAHEALQSIGAWHLLDEFLAKEEISKISRTSYSQPLITALQIGLDRLWRSRGVTPSAVVGHSIGEVAACVSAGCFDLKEGMRVIYHRGRTMDRASSKGAMLAAGISRKTALTLVEPHGDAVSLAAVNGPSSVTFAGHKEKLETIEAILNVQEKFNRFLNVEYAFHSSYMDPVKEDLLESLKDLQCSTPQIPLWSTVTGKKVTKAIHTADYWWKNVRQTVLFGPAIEDIVDSHRLFLEISAHPVLAASITQCLKEKKTPGRCIQSLNRNTDDNNAMDTGLNDLVQAGYPIDWETVYPIKTVPHQDFWPYHWQKKEYWEESLINSQNRLAKIDDILLGRRFDFFDTPTWVNQLDLKVQSFLSDHKVKTHIFFPAAGYIDIFCAAASLCVGEFFELEDFSILSSIVLNTADVKNIRTQFDPLTHQLTLKVSGSGDKRTWDVCATAKAYPVGKAEPSHLDLETFQQNSTFKDDKKTFYQKASEAGLNYGPHFQTAERNWTRGNDILGYTALPEEDSTLFDNTYISPTILDGVFQLIALEQDKKDQDSGLYLPVGFDKLMIQKTAGQNLYPLINVLEHTPEQIRVDIMLYDENGDHLGYIRNFICKAVENRKTASKLWQKQVLYEYWTPRPLDWARAPAAIGSLTETALKNIYQAEKKETARNMKNRVLVKPVFFETPDKMMHRFFIDAIYALNKSYRIGDPIDIRSLVKDSGISKRLEKYTEKLFKHLADVGYAKKTLEGQYCLTPKTNELENIETCMAMCIRNNPETIYDINLVYERGHNLTGLFQGTYDPLSLLVGKDRADYARYFYMHSSAYHGNNQLVMTIIREMLASVPPGTPFRILEIGSGMGGMTANILDLLKGTLCEFYYTDIAPGLVKQGEKQFSDFDFITYKVLDIEQDPGDQGFEPATFDLITCLDVLHAVKDINIALTHVKKLLKTDGKFVLSDISGKPLLVDFLFGPIEGWWRFDDAYRKDSPLLSRQQWEGALKNNGFTDIEAVSDCDGMVHMNFIATNKGDEKKGDEKKDDTKTQSEPSSKETGCIYIGDETICKSNCDTREFTTQYRLADMAAGIKYDGIKAVVYGGALTINGLPKDEAGQWQVTDLLFTHIGQILTDSAKSGTPLRMFVLTSGAFTIPYDNAPINVLHSAMEGLVQVLHNENCVLSIKLIDLDPCIPFPDQLSLVIEEIENESDKEDVVALRQGRRFIKRCDTISRPRSLFRYNPLNDDQNTHAIELTVDSPGTLDGLCLKAVERKPLAPDEVEIQVEAAGINFRDLLKVLGVYPTEASDSKLLGDECAGIVLRVGAKVKGFSKGDRVAAIGLGCFKTHLTLKADILIPLPDFIETDLAAASLTNYATVHYALVMKACIKPGERVLIHAAAGGVGLAAIQIAKNKGGTVFATAGTRFKRHLLKSLGVKYVYNSRTLDFSEKIHRDTRGEGVDIVLNSLAGPYIEKSLGLLRRGGRFLELGKRDIYDKTHISLYPFRKNISYFGIDMADIFSPESNMGKPIVDELKTIFKEKIIKQHCYSLFSMATYKDAFSHMSKALHFGKVVLKPSWGELASPVLYQPQEALVKPDRSYLIIGGARGLGLAIAQWLCKKGANTILLVNRSGKTYPETDADITALKEKAQVLIYKADVSKREEVAALIHDVGKNHPPLDGIFHCAVVLKDNYLKDMTREEAYQVLAPKAFGGIHLHEETKDLELSMFLLMGSISGVLGNVGQSNYAAANSILKSIAHLRHAKGLTAQYIDWGLFRQTGIIARDKSLLKKVQKFGFDGLSNNDFTQYLERILGNKKLIWAVPGVGLEDHLKRTMNVPPRLSLIKNRIKAGKKQEGKAVSSDFASLPKEIRLEKMIETVKQTISNVLDLAIEDIDNDEKLVDIGIDSLNGIELLTQFENELGTSISPTSLVQAPSIRLISERLLTILGFEYDAPKEETKTDSSLEKEKLRNGGPKNDPDLTEALKLTDTLPDFPAIVRNALENRVIFMTGVTGLLGSHTFRDLMTESNCHVYLLIRPDKQFRDLMARLTATNKKFGLNLDLSGLKKRFTLLAGDISKPNLGLKIKSYEMIQQTCDIIFHCAAKVHHLKPYSMLKKANVDGTIEIIKLCITENDIIPLHYVSAIGILLTDFGKEGSLNEEDIPESLSTITNGYIKSKWISECLINKIQKKGFPCTVYRPGLIFSKKSMVTLAGDFLWRILKASMIIGKYPDSIMKLLLTPVNNVSMVILRSIMTNHMNKTYHLFDSVTRFRDLSLAAKNLGYALEPATAAQWHSLSMKLYDADPQNHPLADYLNAYDAKTLELMTLVSERPVSLSCSDTHKLIASLDLPNIEVDTDLLKDCIKELQTLKMIPWPKGLN